MRFLDRVGGTTSETPRVPVLMGRYRVLTEDGEYSLNRCPISDGDALIPDATEHWMVREASDVVLSGRFAEKPILESQDLEAILQLGRLLVSDEMAVEGWLGWSETSPLAPGLERMGDAHPLEERIEKELKHLAEVCRRPRTHIRIEVERELLSRVRRIDRRAPEWLAAHTEDWQHRKVTGIHPRRVLAQVREEQFDLYENRVAVRLVDHLVRWLRGRIREVRRVLEGMFQRMERIKAGTKGNRHRVTRIFNLWGEAWKDETWREILEERVKRLEALLFRLLSLMDSVLYHEIHRRAEVPDALKTTNLLSNDDHYRGVARLWMDWYKLGARQSPSARDLYRIHQETVGGFDAWCMLLLVRALKQLRMEPPEEDWEKAIRPGVILPIDSEAQLAWMKEGTFEVRLCGECVLRVVPLVHPIERMEAANVAAVAQDLVSSASHQRAWTLILHPAAHEAETLSLQSAGNPPRFGMAGAVDFIGVSPFSLDSVERLARSLRWVLLSRRLASYPPRISQVPQCLGDRVNGWFDSKERIVLRVPTSAEVRRLDLDRTIELAAGELQRLRKRRDELDEGREQVDRRQLSELNQEKRLLLPKIGEAETKVRALEDFNRQFQAALASMAAITTCPVCGSAASFQPRQDGCYRAKCPDTGCGTVWELRWDPEGRVKVPVLLPGGADDIDWTRIIDSMAVDEILGQDVLAVPRPEPWPEVRFKAPRDKPWESDLETGLEMSGH